ncbi:MAG: C40 family peptidase [Clostridia bacterium]|nr:C40 family peptidase [Clostridia bacterium]
MKKLLSALLSLFILISMFAACGKTETQPATDGAPQDTASEPQTTPDAPSAEDEDSDKEATETVTETGEVVITTQQPAQDTTPSTPAQQTPSTPAATEPTAPPAPAEETPSQPQTTVKPNPVASGEYSTYVFGDSVMAAHGPIDTLIRMASLSGYTMRNTNNFIDNHNTTGTYNLYELCTMDGTKPQAIKSSKFEDIITGKLDCLVLLSSRDRALMSNTNPEKVINAFEYIQKIYFSANPKGKILLLVPMPYLNADCEQMEKFVGKGVTSAEHSKKIKDFAAKCAAKATGKCVQLQIGDAFEYFNKNYGSLGLDLYDEELLYPSVAGAYYMSCLMYAATFEKSPCGIEDYGFLDKSTATEIQKAAHKFYFGTEPPAITSSGGEGTYVEPELKTGRELLQQAVVAVANAYYAHRPNIQYDQLMMDRVGRMQPRYEFNQPEAASFQRDLYFECGVFCRNVYETAFGFQTPKASVVLDPDFENAHGERPFYWKGGPGAEDKKVAEAALRSTLQPGDILYYNYVENNHVMLYVGNNEFMHCSNATPGGDYDYSSFHDRNEVTALFMATVDETLAKRDLFNDVNKVCLYRPFELGIKPTEDTLIRIKKLQDLYIEKTTTAPRGVSVSPGGTVEITVLVRNLGKTSRTVTITETAPAHMTIESDQPAPWTLTIPAGESKTVKYKVKIDADCPTGIVSFKNTKIEGMTLNDTPIYVGKTLTPEQQNKFTSFNVSTLTATDENKLVTELYSKALGMDLAGFTPAAALTALFKEFNTDASKTVPVLSDSTPFSKWFVYEQYGGQKCSTMDGGVGRTRNVRNINLIPGDIVVYSKDGKSDTAAAFVYLGGTDAAAIVSGKAAKVFSSQLLDKLLGQYCFCVLRPSFDN